MSTFAEYRSRREDRLAQGVDLEKMRLGQAACEVIQLPSDPEIRFALVPLTEGEYKRSLEFATLAEMPDTTSSNLVREEVQKTAVIFFASRQFRDLTKFYFEDMAEVDELDHIDVAYCFDVYLEMTAQISPSMMGLSEEDFQQFNRLLPRISWSELSGPQWYAAQRFLNLIRPLLLTVESSGSQPT